MLKNNEMPSFMIILQEALSWDVKFALNPIDLVHPIFVSRSKGIQDLSCTSAAQVWLYFCVTIPKGTR